MPWIAAIPAAALPPGRMLAWEHRGVSFVLCNHEGEVRALHGVCPHSNGPLAQGNFVDGLLVCPWHAWEFDTASGACTHNDRAAVARYEVDVRQGVIHIRLA
jgi:nitrite reductase (NADH) small subunit